MVSWARVWQKGYGKLATTRQGSKHCTKCYRPGHLQEDCWGSCKWCKKTNHPSDRCFNKPKDDSNAEKANKTKKKPNKKKKKAKKAAMPALIDEEESEDDDSDSEEPSPVKHEEKRIARAELDRGAIPKRSLADKINEMDPEQREDFAKEIKHAWIAKAARSSSDNAHLPCKVLNKLNGGRCSNTDGCFDSGCTHPLVTREVTEDLKIKLEPVTTPLRTIQADGTALEIIGSVILYLEAENMKGRRRIECAVIEGNGAREMLISLEYLKRWNIVHSTFPRENLDDYLSRKYFNKQTAYYSESLNLNKNLYEVDREIREPSERCRKKREEILKKHPECFQEVLEKGDRIKHPPVKIRLRENSGVCPSHCSRPY